MTAYKKKSTRKPAKKVDSSKRKKATGKKRGLWDNIHAKRKRIKAGSGERMRKVGSKGAPTAKAIKRSQSKKKK